MQSRQSFRDKAHIGPIRKKTNEIPAFRKKLLSYLLTYTSYIHTRRCSQQIRWRRLTDVNIVHRPSFAMFILSFYFRNQVKITPKI